MIFYDYFGHGFEVLFVIVEVVFVVFEELFIFYVFIECITEDVDGGFDVLVVGVEAVF